MEQISCVYVTDPDWFNHLRKSKITENVNFWRKDKRKLKIQPGSKFYFKLRGTTKIFGRAVIGGIFQLPFEEAWQKYGEGNGVKDKQEFEKEVRKVLKFEDNKPVDLNCIVLNSIEFLEDEKAIPVSKDFFPSSILGGKYYRNNELDWVDEYFISNNSSSINDSELAEFSKEGKKRLSSHFVAERNSQIVKEAKGSRPWNCKLCNILFQERYGYPYIEAHHKIPLYKSGEKINKPEDLELLCPNCHKAVHIVMDKEPSKTFEEIIIQLTKT